ncbi:hypothetical protein PR048_010206, partial [Dryococelus australis]
MAYNFLWYAMLILDVLRIEVYSGKGAEETGVMTLLNRLLGSYFDKDFTVYMDHYYSSPVVFDYLWEHKTKAVGICMTNRKGLPQSTVVKQKIKKGEVISTLRKHLLCLKWRDTREVLMLSTCHTSSTTDDDVCPLQEPVTKTKSDVVLDYNIQKTGPYKRKQLNWWEKLFFHIFVMSATNTFVLYKETRNPEEPTKCRLVQFLIQLGNAFVEEGNKEQQISSLPDRSKHQTGKLARKETYWWCPDCSVALCVSGCFKVYHTKANY